jgi:type II secretory pathway component GspD/PulD (secretin)
MRKTIIYYLLLVIILILQGCSNTYKEELLKEELRTDLDDSHNPILKKPAVEIIEVKSENFAILKPAMPNTVNIKHAKIFGADLENVVALLSEATNQNIIFQSQSNSKGSGASARNAKVYLAASNIDFSKLLKKTVGNKLSMRYENGTYYLGYSKTVTLKVPPLKGLAGIMKSTLTTLGATKIAQDSITSSITFTAKEKEYKDIMNYLQILRNNLYVIEYDIAIYNVELNDKNSLGINWDIVTKKAGDLTFNAATSAGAGIASVGSPTATFGAIINGSDVDVNSIASALSSFGKVESIQRPTLIGIAGTDVVLKDGTSESYIKELTTTVLGGGNANALQTSTVSGTALSGISITLNSNMMDGTVLTDITLDINDITSYTEFTVGGVTYSQPKTVTKHIQNSMRVQPGVPIVISGLFRHKKDKGYQGIPGMEKTAARLLGGAEYEGSTKSEMVIIVTPRVIKYVVK